MSEVAPPPVAVDVLLGAERVAGSQLIKQADVLMLHHLVPDEVAAGSLGPCLAFYEPRTAHGSSLSPAISASLLARSGQPERALELFRMAARLDLDDLTGTTAGGLHLATMGGVWQALAYGLPRSARRGLRGRAGHPRRRPLPPRGVVRSRSHVPSFADNPSASAPITTRSRSPARRRSLCASAGRAPQRCEPPGATFSLAPPTSGRRQR